MHDNVERPFKIFATKSKIEIFMYKDKDIEDNDIYTEDVVYDVLLLSITKFIEYWVGMHSSNFSYDLNGNSIHIQETKTSFVSLGWIVQRFDTDEEILDYASHIGNSDVPILWLFQNIMCILC